MNISKRVLLFFLSLSPAVAYCADMNSLQSLEQEAANGNSQAEYKLGKDYLIGRMVNENLRKSVLYAKESAEQGNPLGEYLYASICSVNGKQNGFISRKNKPEAEKMINEIKKQARNGNIKAEAALGNIYSVGVHDLVKKNYSKSFYWYKKAAASGYVTAERSVGYDYEYGEAVSKNYHKALYWYKKAVEEGSANAEFNISTLYASGGIGVPKNAKKALYYERIAAEQGSHEAQFVIGLRYYYGSGVKKNYVKASYWWEKAAKNGSKRAKKEIALHKFFGYGMTLSKKHDQKNVITILKEEAAQGNPRAKLILKLDSEYGGD